MDNKDQAERFDISPDPKGMLDRDQLKSWLDAGAPPAKRTKEGPVDPSDFDVTNYWLEAHGTEVVGDLDDELDVAIDASNQWEALAEREEEERARWHVDQVLTKGAHVGPEYEDDTRYLVNGKNITSSKNYPEMGSVVESMNKNFQDVYENMPQICNVHGNTNFVFANISFDGVNHLVMVENQDNSDRNLLLVDVNTETTMQQLIDKGFVTYLPAGVSELPLLVHRKMAYENPDNLQNPEYQVQYRVPLETHEYLSIKHKSLLNSLIGENSTGAEGERFLRNFDREGYNLFSVPPSASDIVLTEAVSRGFRAKAVDCRLNGTKLSESIRFKRSPREGFQKWLGSFVDTMNLKTIFGNDEQQVIDVSGDIEGVVRKLDDHIPYSKEEWQDFDSSQGKFKGVGFDALTTINTISKYLTERSKSVTGKDLAISGPVKELIRKMLRFPGSLQNKSFKSLLELSK